MRIDAHQHFWRLSNPFCTWPTRAEAKIHADFGPGDIAPLLAAGHIEGTVLVQAAPALAETRFLLNLADEAPFVKGVVGWIDMDAGSALADLDALAAHRLFCGIRPMLQAIPDPAWMLKPSFDGIYRRLVELGLTFDALVTPAHLDMLSELAKRHPDLSIIVDHAAKPAIGDGRAGFDEWAPRIARLAGSGNVSCKLSGLMTQAKPGAGAAELAPWLDHLYAVFGPERLLWGSDWPVVLMAADYAAWIAICEAWLADKPASARDNIFGETACRIYALAGVVERDMCMSATGGGQHGTH